MGCCTPDKTYSWGAFDCPMKAHLSTEGTILYVWIDRELYFSCIMGKLKNVDIKHNSVYAHVYIWSGSYCSYICYLLNIDAETNQTANRAGHQGKDMAFSRH
jgi:hypothetical protein